MKNGRTSRQLDGLTDEATRHGESGVYTVRTPTGPMYTYSNATRRTCSNFKTEVLALQTAYIAERTPDKTCADRLQGRSSVTHPGMVLAKYSFQGKFMPQALGAIQEAVEFEANEALCGLSRHVTVNVLLSNLLLFLCLYTHWSMLLLYIRIQRFC